MASKNSIVLAATIVANLVSGALATPNWIGPSVSGQWGTAGNWSPSQVPLVTDSPSVTNATIDLGGVDRTVNALEITGNVGLTNGTLIAADLRPKAFNAATFTGLISGRDALLQIGAGLTFAGSAVGAGYQLEFVGGTATAASPFTGPLVGEEFTLVQQGKIGSTDVSLNGAMTLDNSAAVVADRLPATANVESIGGVSGRFTLRRSSRWRFE